MKQLRTVTVLIALVMSGLAFVAVAPAPPAAADLQMTLTQGSIDVERSITPFCTGAVSLRRRGFAGSTWARKVSSEVSHPKRLRSASIG